MRVVVESRREGNDGTTEYFGTIGVSGNIIDASWAALVDAYEYHLIHDEERELSKVSSKELYARFVRHPPEKFPRHIAIIMDGNGRWAIQRGLERVRGHQNGAKLVRSIVTDCAQLRKEFGGPDFLTLYSFSLENWKRPAEEVSFLMQMYIDYLRSSARR